jgi:hypothetical protein
MKGDRAPNSGPYVVRFNSRPFTEDGIPQEEECQTWDDTCRFLRSLLLDGYKVTGVAFC